MTIQKVTTDLYNLNVSHGHVRDVFIVLGGQSCGENHGRCDILGVYAERDTAAMKAKGRAAWGTDGSVEVRAAVFLDDRWFLIDAKHYLQRPGAEE